MSSAGVDNAVCSGLSRKPQDFIAGVAAGHQNPGSLAGCREGHKGKYCRRQNLGRWTVLFFFLTVSVLQFITLFHIDEFPCCIGKDLEMMNRKEGE